MLTMNFTLFLLLLLGYITSSFKISFKQGSFRNPSVTHQLPKARYHTSDQKANTVVYMSSNGDDPNEDEAFCCETDEDFTEEGSNDDNVEESEVLDEAPSESIEDPQAQLIKLKVDAIKNQISQIESRIAFEKTGLLKAKDKVSESGKTGFFIVQAQVNDFLRKKDAEQKKAVKLNQKEFVMKMLPVIDAFRQAPMKAPGTTEREQNMHKNYGSLLSSILTVFEKFGFKEFQPEIGSAYQMAKHDVTEIRIDPSLPDNSGTIVQCVASGVVDKEGDIIRKAKVVISKKEETATAISSQPVDTASSTTQEENVAEEEEVE